MNKSLLTKEQLDFFKETGYIIIDDIFEQEYASKFLRAIRRHADDNFAAIINPDRDDSLKKVDTRPKSDLTMEEIGETSQMCRDVISNKKIVSMLREIQQNDVVCLSSQIIFKEAYSSYSAQAWLPHQDNRYIDNENGQYLTANWFLRDTDPDNGGIYIYPGTHKLPLLPAPDRKSYREDPGEAPGRECMVPEEFLDKKLDIVTKAGSVVIMHGNCIHGSYANESSRSRPWYSTCYITKGEYYNVGKSSKRREISFE